MCANNNPNQKDNLNIEVPLFHKGLPIDASTLTNAIYKLYSANKRIVHLEKTLGHGITATEQHLVISITEDDSKTLSGTYYHELTIFGPANGRSNAFKQEITFQATKN